MEIKLFFKLVKFAIIFTYTLINYNCKKTDNLVLDGAPKVGDYYVSINGNDNYPGNSDSAWRTIQKAINTILPGDIVIVRPGEYTEVLTIKTSGTSDENRLNIFSEYEKAAKCNGFNITGSYITIDGFEIESGNKNWAGIIAKNSQYLNIQNCRIHDCPMGAIFLTNNSNYSKIIKNVIEHNGNWGISVSGSNALIEGNEIKNTVQYHPKGQEPGWTGADADGMRIFGSDHIIRSNSIINIGDPDDSGNTDPHPDGIQSWDDDSGNDNILTNSIIEGNYISIKHQAGKGVMLEATNGNAAHDIIFRNNIIEFRDIGIDLYQGQFNNIYIYNNVFKANLNDKSWGTSVYLNSVSNYQVINNITIDCHPEHRKIIDGNGLVDYNIAWNSDGSTPGMQPPLQPNDKISNPIFLLYTGRHGENDYHLGINSPAINTGFKIDQVSKDYDNIERPQGSSYDIGPFEFKN